ncbi:nucleoside diphosphate kinase homolog 5 [Caerostris darwini]|uniref:Nucleoside diphosphate kinase homolog 5 n=1 Tax=Caerostris darwini TaxID=1538125 RepID=A0AAV4Q7D0_9ARAC|nr:nucleoside diphosphate kinase homolog 5 [Caerostris darwini]
MNGEETTAAPRRVARICTSRNPVTVLVCSRWLNEYRIWVKTIVVMLFYEKTLAIISPNLLPKTPEIKAIIESSGLGVLQERRVQLRKDQAVHFFSRQPTTDRLQKANSVDDDDDVKRDLKAFLDSMTSGPIDVLIIAGFDAVHRWLELIGQADPEILRGEQTNCINVLFGDGVHGSGDLRTASREIRFFFPDTKFEANYGLGSAREYLSQTVSPLLLKGLVTMSKEKPQIPVLWMAQWLLRNRPHEL